MIDFPSISLQPALARLVLAVARALSAPRAELAAVADDAVEEDGLTIALGCIINLPCTKIRFASCFAIALADKARETSKSSSRQSHAQTPIPKSGLFGFFCRIRFLVINLPYFSATASDLGPPLPRAHGSRRPGGVRGPSAAR